MIEFIPCIRPELVVAFWLAPQPLDQEAVDDIGVNHNLPYSSLDQTLSSVFPFSQM